VRADLLERLGRREEAYAELTRAAGMTDNEQERVLLLERAARLARREEPR
jgi:predicted RNA polymerase sigma factor